jgi:ribosomal protein uS4
MGSPKKLRKGWSRPKKPFDRARLEYEAELKKEYGFKRKREIWKIKQKFKNIKRRARTILATHDENEKKVLMEKLQKYGIADKNASIDDVLNLSLEAFCNRRLQTVVLKKGMANTNGHARQIITHRKILIGETIVDMPNYMVSLEDEKKIKVKEKKAKPKIEEKPTEAKTEGFSEPQAKLSEIKEEDLVNPYLS